MTDTAASKRRRLLALVLDYFFFIVLWKPVAMVLVDVGVPADSGVVGLLLFALVAGAWRALGRPTPGQWALGLRRVEAELHVDARILGVEAWWTMLAGSLGVMDGAKKLIRWTSDLPPPPFFGLELGEPALDLALFALGALELIAAVLVLRGLALGALLGLLELVVELASLALGYDAFFAWVEARTIARRAAQGLSVRPEEVELMQLMLPGGVMLAVLVGGSLLAMSYRRFSR